MQDVRFAHSTQIGQEFEGMFVANDNLIGVGDRKCKSRALQQAAAVSYVCEWGYARRQSAINLDFGANAFDGAARFLEIGVRAGGGQSYTTLNPRQAVTSIPYAVKSLNANQATTALTANDSLKLGSIPAAQYTQNNDARLSDARTPLPNSTYYIQNGTNQQSASNFNCCSGVSSSHQSSSSLLDSLFFITQI